MKKLYFLITLCLLTALQACVEPEVSSKWVEDKHYKVISDTATESPVVTEFFSFWCPHCYSYEPIVAKVKQQLDKDVAFNKVHVNFMRFAGPDVQEDATRAMLVARSLGREEELNQAIFSYIHEQRLPITGINQLKGIFLARGIELAEFDKIVSSFKVKTMLDKNRKAIETYREHLSGVPNFIVNGKYQMTVTSDMTVDDIIELIVWLSTQS
ncbi:thiol:disulfide interchange protein DsbA/DsbL [Aliiglaciecola litoralis]|uniref:Thiol:disulfide interchange protein n=1 Tax=Aliiglaciecola litoralis TaxID=582857 RepID=A0ABP3X2N2_9ALTE